MTGMETTTTEHTPHVDHKRFVATPDRPDIRGASIVLVGAWSDHYDSRGVEVVAVITYADGEVERRQYDFVPGPQRLGTYGGWDPDDRRLSRWMNNAAEWLRADLVPPCSPHAS